MQYKNIYSALMLLGSLVLASSCGDNDLSSLAIPQEGEINENKIISSETSTPSNQKNDDQVLNDPNRHYAKELKLGIKELEIGINDQELNSSELGKLFLSIKDADVDIPNTHPLMEAIPERKTDHDTNEEVPKPKKKKVLSKVIGLFKKKNIEVVRGEPNQAEKEEITKELEASNKKNLNDLKKLFVVLGYAFVAKENKKMISSKDLEPFIKFDDSKNCSKYDPKLLAYVVPEKWEPVISDIGKLLEHVGAELELTNAIQESSPKQTNSDVSRSHMSKESTKRPEKKAKNQKKQIKQLNKQCEKSISEQKKILQAAIDNVNKADANTNKTALDDLFTGPIKEALEAALELYQEKDSASVGSEKD